jgi:hypothetical protein
MLPLTSVTKKRAADADCRWDVALGLLCVEETFIWVGGLSSDD